MTRTESAEKRRAELSAMTPEQLQTLCVGQECATDVGTLDKNGLILHIMGGEGYDVEMNNGEVVIVEYEDEEVVTANSASPEIAPTVIATPAPAPAKPATSKPKLWVDEKVLADPRKCPLIIDGKLCGAEKLAKHYLCSACHKTYGWSASQLIRRVKERANTRIAPERFRSILEVLRDLIVPEDSEEDLKVLAFLIARKPADRFGTDFPDFSDVSSSTIMAAINVVKGEMEKSAEEAKNKAANAERWQWTLDQIRTTQPEGPLDPAAFKGLVFRDAPISEAMIHAACRVLWEGDEAQGILPRWKEWAKGAGEICRQEVCKTWPEEDDQTGRSIEDDFFSDEEIKRRGLAYQGKAVTTRMMEIACKGEKYRRREQAKRAKEAEFLARAQVVKTGGNGDGHQRDQRPRNDNGGRRHDRRPSKGNGGTKPHHNPPPLKNGIRGLESVQ